MDLNSSPIEIFFFPYVGGGHQIPMIDMARVFASHGAKSTIISTPKQALSFQKTIHRNQQLGLSISIHTLKLPENDEISDTDMSATPFTDTSILQEPLKDLLIQRKPNCIVHDMFHRWAPDAIDGLEIDIARILFTGSCCYARCVRASLAKYKPYEKVGSDYEPFVVPGLPDRIELTRSKLPPGTRQPEQHQDHKKMHKVDENISGVLVNSFYDLEPAYVEYFKNELGYKSWLVGPVSLCNRDVEDKTERGKLATIDDQSITTWLDSKKPNSVLYISFGSLARLAPAQLIEIANGLEASNYPFIWVVGKISKSADQGPESEPETYLPSGFEEKIRKSNIGLIIRGWSPQLLILEHAAVGGFMTHCGWNSTLEGLSAGVPMITWPIAAEQFENEKLITEVLKIGVNVGSIEWASWNTQPSAVVGKEKVEAAVRRLMGGGDEVAEMRRRVRELGEKAKRAIEEGGSSYRDVDSLMEELKRRCKGGA
ncbi:abscisate beta-glucosyltransferase-like [Tripterygium wilfordii]|uniref:Glycosyltransferase n=1 Tax=Tripterygium wilfordii TaxID=458696 RepID=A0A7J7DGX3_TRIWF|nr:abscisate beta-glucosyltransferase-like [Tripterygium wilfordii]KAF5745607.1 abscisate beta-glucosyltransferase-like [Tripterygium wilfordii]